MHELLSFQFNSATYSVRQLLSLKLLMDSECTQTSSSKNITAPNIWGETSIFTLPVKVPLCQKNVKMMF